MEKNTQKGGKLWFRAKQYGYGWTPSSVEGWLVIAVYIGVIFFGSRYIVSSSPQDFFSVFVLFAAATAAVLAISLAKGETVLWYWGDRPAEPLREKNHPSVYLCFLIPLFILGMAFWIRAYIGAEMSAQNPAVQSASLAAPSSPKLLIGSETLNVEIADTPALRSQGLSGRAGLAPHSGMLFVFPAPMRDGFWMKDMTFSLDIIWLDSDLRVLAIKQNATPESFPEVFSPDVLAKYVLEVPAGFAAAHELSVGSQAAFAK